MTAVPIYPDEYGEIVEIQDDHVVLNGFREDDPEVVHAMHEAEDPSGSIHQFLAVGARASRAASTSLDLNLVQRTFDSLNRDFGQEVDSAIKRVEQCTEHLLAEDDGALTTTLTELRDSLAELLDDRFDDDSKSSVIGKIDAMLSASHEEQRQMLRRVLDPSDDGPLGRIKDELTKTLKGHTEDLRKDLHDIATKLAVSEREAEILELTTGKGFTFEDLVDQTVGHLAAPYGDVHERVGNEKGATGSQRGDEVVTLNTNDTNGRTLCFVLEAKDRKLSMRATLAELDEAMANRGADVAIAVFSNQDAAPTRVPFHQVGDNRAIVVLDKATSDEGALRLAYMWARWTLRRAESESVHDLNPDCIREAIDDARQALNRCTNIKRAHATIRKKVDEASNQLASMQNELDGTLSDLGELL